jgi:dipeptidyl aminopeptidase/acylaminoacyl peptidase
MKSWVAGVLGLSALLACVGETPVRRELPSQAGAASGRPAEPPAAAAVPRVVRGNLTTELVVDLDPGERSRLERYLEVRRADLAGWDGAGGGLYVLTRLANVVQLHRVAAPLGMRRQLSFGAEGVDVFVPTPAQRGGGVLVADEGGSEYTQLYLLDDEGNQRLFTDGKSRNESPVWSRDGARVAYSSTQRNARDFDIWTFDATRPDAAPLLAHQANGMWQVLDWSPAGDRLLVLHEISETRSELSVLEPGRGLSHEVKVAGLAPGAEVAFVGGVFDAEAAGIYYLSDHGGELRALWYRDLATGQSQKLSGDLKWDLEKIVASPDRGRLALTLNEAGWSRLLTFDTRTRRLGEDIALPPSIIRSLAFSPDGRRLALTLEGGRAVGDVHVVDLDAAPAAAARPSSPRPAVRTALTRWTESEVGGLDSSRFHEPRLIEYDSFDGRKIPALVYTPEGPGPHPVLVSIHGGPEGQSRPFFSPLNEYLVNELSIAVVLPNVRGSTGYGRAYTLLDNAERREDSVKDIGALLDWIAKRPELDSRRVAVYGASYGGYMSLATGATFGDRVAAVVDVVGISNFVTFLESTKEYRRDLRRVEYGDERVPAMREFLRRISPLENSTRIVAPLFVAQGANDPRVPLSEAEQIVTKLRAEGREVWFMLAADEGHGFQKKANRDAFAAAAVAFYRKHLLGRRE